MPDTIIKTAKMGLINKKTSTKEMIFISNFPLSLIDNSYFSWKFQRFKVYLSPCIME